VPNRAPPLLTELLQAVSRSFYLTLRVLPGSVRPQIGLAYLLARTTDTIADTEMVPVARRLAVLNDLGAVLQGTARAETHLSFPDLAAAQPEVPGGGTNSERILLERVAETVSLLANLSPGDRQRVREVLKIIISGQELDLQRFADASVEQIVPLTTSAELEDYTYRVAGCVGEFWTRICRAHALSSAALDDATLLRDGVRLGKGLQLVNILRDLPRDLRQGRCYLPVDRLATVQLLPQDLLQSSSMARLRPIYDELLNQAEDHLAAGWAYTNSLPRSAMRLRLASAWPVLIGVKTIAKLRRENPLEATHRVKVTRAEVKGILAGTLIKYPFPAAWRAQFARLKE